MKSNRDSEKGLSLIELVITLMILSVLTLGALPLVQNAVQRQKEERLREALREMRTAIDEFKRDAIGSCTQGNATNQNLPQNIAPNQNVVTDPRSRVVISDCKIFDTENLDRYPPSLEMLVDGVMVKPRASANAIGSAGTGGVFGQNATETLKLKDENATDEKKKVYLREIPVDPITGEKTWKLRSSYQEKDSGEWDSINVFDVRSSADGEALNGEKYAEW